MAETWRPIPEWEGYYEVSDHGMIRSVDRVVPRAGTSGQRVRGRVMKLWANDAGYLYVMGRKRGKSKRIWVHRSVLEAFVGSRPEGLVCMHLNNDPADNRMENLRWGTQQENIIQSVSEGRQANTKKTHCPRGHKLALPNLNAYILSQGRRACRACYKATQKYPLKEYGNEFVTEIANDNYARIMGAA